MCLRQCLSSRSVCPSEAVEPGLPPEDVARLLSGWLAGSGGGGGGDGKDGGAAKRGGGVLELGGRVASLENASRSLQSGQKLVEGKLLVLVETIAEMDPPG
eukprot:SAG22_NODE_1626_length_3956_cov_2.706767_8_plen_101_part_00